MSFWDLSDGTSAVTTDKEFDAGGGMDFEPLPKGTSVLVSVEDIAWKAAYQRTEEFVNLKCGGVLLSAASACYVSRRCVGCQPTIWRF